MMKKFLILLLTFNCALGAIACGNDNLGNSSTEETEISFLSLQEAFDSGEVFQSDLIEMSNLLNSNNTLSLDLAKREIVQEIKIAYSELNAVEIENIELKYYGEYNGNYAVIIRDKNEAGATVVTEVTIANVTFNYPTSGVEIVICKTP